jgi:hypothetical protein
MQIFLNIVETEEVYEYRFHSSVPDIGDHVSIKGKKYKVFLRGYEVSERDCILNIFLEKT